MYTIGKFMRNIRKSKEIDVKKNKKFDDFKQSYQKIR